MMAESTVPVANEVVGDTQEPIAECSESMTHYYYQINEVDRRRIDDPAWRQSEYNRINREFTETTIAGIPDIEDVHQPHAAPCIARLMTQREKGEEIDKYGSFLLYTLSQHAYAGVRERAVPYKYPVPSCRTIAARGLCPMAKLPEREELDAALEAMGLELPLADEAAEEAMRVVDGCRPVDPAAPHVVGLACSRLTDYHLQQLGHTTWSHETRRACPIPVHTPLKYSQFILRVVNESRQYIRKRLKRRIELSYT